MEWVLSGSFTSPRGGMVSSSNGGMEPPQDERKNVRTKTRATFCIGCAKSRPKGYVVDINSEETEVRMLNFTPPDCKYLLTQIANNDGMCLLFMQ